MSVLAYAQKQNVELRNTSGSVQDGSLGFVFPGPTQAEAQISAESARKVVKRDFSYDPHGEPVADGIVKARRLKQIEVADLLGIRQPDVSKMLRGEFRQFSVERLLRFLVALNQDVEIVVKPHRDTSNAPALHVS